MIVAGLTGSIGMGKSTVAAYLRERGVPILDADRVVHDLYAGEAVPLIEAAFPGATRDGAVDRIALAAQVVGAPAAFEKLEAIIHPLVRAAEWTFLEAEREKGAALAVLEIPLLFETASSALFDAIIVVSAPADAQRARIMARPGMTAEKLDALLGRQMPDAEKRAKADFVVDTGVSHDATRQEIDAALAAILKRPALAYQRWKALRNT